MRFTDPLMFVSGRYHNVINNLGIEEFRGYRDEEIESKKVNLVPNTASFPFLWGHTGPIQALNTVLRCEHAVKSR